MKQMKFLVFLTSLFVESVIISYGLWYLYARIFHETAQAWKYPLLASYELSLWGVTVPYTLPLLMVLAVYFSLRFLTSSLLRKPIESSQLFFLGLVIVLSIPLLAALIFKADSSKHDILLYSAKSEEPMDLFALGEAYEHGTYGFPEDPSVAFTYYQSAAGRGLGLASYKVAQFYEKGAGVKKSYCRALFWSFKAANEQCFEAFAMIGDYSAQGMCGDKDPVMAAACFQIAVDAKIEGSEAKLAEQRTALSEADIAQVEKLSVKLRELVASGTLLSTFYPPDQNSPSLVMP